MGNDDVRNYDDELDEYVYYSSFDGLTESTDKEMGEILEKFYSMLVDMRYHDWSDDSEMYGGITFREFKRIFITLLESVDKQ